MNECWLSSSSLQGYLLCKTSDNMTEEQQWPSIMNLLNVKGKVIPELNYVPHHKAIFSAELWHHEHIWGIGGTTPHIELDGGEWSTSCPGWFTPGDKWVGGLVALRAGPHMVAETNNPFPYHKLNSSYTACSLVTALNKLPQLSWTC